MWNTCASTASTLSISQLENFICDEEVVKFVGDNEEVTLGQVLRYFSKKRRNFVWGYIIGRVHTMVQEGKLYMSDRRTITLPGVGALGKGPAGE